MSSSSRIIFVAFLLLIGIAEGIPAHQDSIHKRFVQVHGPGDATGRGSACAAKNCGKHCSDENTNSENAGENRFGYVNWRYELGTSSFRP